jgi:hypothetical protein
MTALWLIVAAALPCWGTYRLIVSASQALPRTTATTICRLCLAFGIGLGWGSGSYYFWLLTFGRTRGMYLAIDALFWFLLSCFFRADRSALAAMNESAVLAARRGLRPDRCMICREEQARLPAGLRRMLNIAFAAVLAVALAGMVGQALAEPHGGWDAWTIWSVRARFLYRLRDDWPQALTATFHHTDYPLLVPASIARCWTFLGRDPSWVGAAVGIAFTLATVVLVSAAVAQRHGAVSGMLAGIVILGTVRFLSWGAMQYADVPLAFFYLSTLVLLMQHDAVQRSANHAAGSGLLLLAGVTTGLAAWTKNEGLLFAAVVSMVVLARAARERGLKGGWRRGGLVLMGAAPALAMVFVFKSRLPISNDLFLGQDLSAVIGRVLDPSRHFKIMVTALTTGVQVAHLFAAAIPVCFFLLGTGRRRDWRLKAWSLPAGIIGLVAGGYYSIYLTTPHDLDWHLSTSLDRLIVQLWPMAVLTMFLELRSPEEVLALACDEREAKAPAPAESGAICRAA